MYEVIIVGAGPAGSAAAATLAKAGRSLLVIEQAAMPRHKHCAGGLTRSALEALTRLEIDCSRTFQQYYSSVILGYHEIQQRLFIDEHFATAMYRDAFDAALAQHAVHLGAELLIDTVIGIDRHDQQVSVTTKTRGCITARALIGADGVHSLVRRQLQIPYPKDRLGIGFECEVPVSRRIIDQTYGEAMHLDFSYLPAGVWAFPKRRGGTINVGLGYARSDHARLARAPRDILIEFIKRQGLCDNTNELVIHADVLPLQGTCEVFGRGPVLLTGDAAGFVDPPSGEGITYALQSGAIAGESVSHYIATGEDPSQRFTKRVQPLVTNINRYGRTLRSFTLQLLSGRFLTPRRVIELFSSDPTFTKMIRAFYTKRMNYRQAATTLFLKTGLMSIRNRWLRTRC
jgi:geranylgeranyl reductase family protein